MRKGPQEPIKMRTTPEGKSPNHGDLTGPESLLNGDGRNLGPGRPLQRSGRTFPKFLHESVFVPGSRRSFPPAPTVPLCKGTFRCFRQLKRGLRRLCLGKRTRSRGILVSFYFHLNSCFPLHQLESESSPRAEPLPDSCALESHR